MEVKFVVPHEHNIYILHMLTKLFKLTSKLVNVKTPNKYMVLFIFYYLKHCVVTQNMSFTGFPSEFIDRLQPPVSQVNTEPLSIVKNEPPESDIIEILSDVSSDEIIQDIKNIDILSHNMLNEDSIKIETVSKDLHENKHLESMETQAIVKTDYPSLLKIENIIPSEIIIKTEEDTSDDNVNRGVIEPQDSNALDNLDTGKQLLNCSNDLNDITIKTDFSESYGTCEITILKDYKEKIKVIKAPVMPVKTDEYISLTNDKHVCNYCKSASNNLRTIIAHIKKKHRENQTMYQCVYCPHKAKRKSQLSLHIIIKHKDVNVHKDIQWFKCHLCDVKFKLKLRLKKHMFKHMQDRSTLCPFCRKGFKGELHVRKHVRTVHTKASLKRYNCEECEYTTHNKQHIKLHIENRHREPHECSECGYKTKYMKVFKWHKERHEIRGTN